MKLQLNPAMEVQASMITPQHPCVVVDNFLLNAEEIVNFAIEHENDFQFHERAYPGVVLPFSKRFP